MENLNGVDVYFDMTDVDFYERYMEQAGPMDEAINMALTEEETKDYRNIVNLFRKRCTAVRTFLDEVCGKGTAERVLGMKSNIKVCHEVYVAIIEIADRQGVQLYKEMNELTARTSVLKS